MGRFLQEDSDPGQLNYPITYINKFIYTANNPINFTDPSGLIFGDLGDITGNFLEFTWKSETVRTFGIMIIGIAANYFLGPIWGGAITGALSGARAADSADGNILRGAVIGAVAGAIAGYITKSTGHKTPVAVTGGATAGGVTGFTIANIEGKSGDDLFWATFKGMVQGGGAAYGAALCAT